jgi:hypothetical protein
MSSSIGSSRARQLGLVTLPQLLGPPFAVGFHVIRHERAPNLLTAQHDADTVAINNTILIRVGEVRGKHTGEERPVSELANLLVG